LRLKTLDAAIGFSEIFFAAFNRRLMCCNAGLESEADVEDFFLDQKSSLAALGAVVFDAKSLNGDEIRRDSTITYKIRLRAEQYEGTYRPMSSPGKWLTSHMVPRRPVVGPRGDMYGGEQPGCQNASHAYAYLKNLF